VFIIIIIHIMKVNGDQNYLVTNILSNILSCFSQKKETFIKKGLELHDSKLFEINSL